MRLLDFCQNMSNYVKLNQNNYKYWDGNPVWLDPDNLCCFFEPCNNFTFNPEESHRPVESYLKNLLDFSFTAQWVLCSLYFTQCIIYSPCWRVFMKDRQRQCRECLRSVSLSQSPNRAEQVRTGNPRRSLDSMQIGASIQPSSCHSGANSQDPRQHHWTLLLLSSILYFPSYGLVQEHQIAVTLVQTHQTLDNTTKHCCYFQASYIFHLFCRYVQYRPDIKYA